MDELYRRSPVMFAAHPLRFVINCAIIVAAVVSATQVSWLYYPGWGVAAIGLAMLAWWYIDHRNTTVIVRDDRIVHRHGIFAKYHVEVSRASIRTVRVDQTLLDRFLRCGTLHVTSAGDQPDIHQNGLPAIMQLQNALRKIRGD